MSRNLTSALVDDLRARIVDGRFSPGERLPSEITLRFRPPPRWPYKIKPSPASASTP